MKKRIFTMALCLAMGMSMMAVGANAENGYVTRGEFIGKLWEQEGCPVINYLMMFDDVTSEGKYTEAIRWASGEKLANGYGNGRFGADDIITREQLATILYRYEQSKGGGFKGMWMFLLRFDDTAEISEWAYEPMCWMTMNGIIEGDENNNINPKSGITQAEMEEIFARFNAVER